MTKLNIELCVAKEEAMDVLEKLSIDKFKARRVLPIEGADSLNIDGGLNDIRARITDTGIEFFCRYARERAKYESVIRNYCFTNGIEKKEL
ncbi:hypothetical protein [Alteromonas australica]|uniref:hypothetical protein n=1 Tax=Alteromonas australica TaxID=589873 RepID=UPI0035C840FA